MIFPRSFERLYGGLLGLDEPRLVANFVSTPDGAVAIPLILESNNVIAAGSKADHLVMGLLRALADVVLIVRVLRASPQDGCRRRCAPPATDALAELRHAGAVLERPEVAVLVGPRLDRFRPTRCHSVQSCSRASAAHATSRAVSRRRPRSSRSVTTSSSRHALS